jgi:hypothetical protein
MHFKNFPGEDPGLRFKRRRREGEGKGGKMETEGKGREE